MTLYLALTPLLPLLVGALILFWFPRGSRWRRWVLLVVHSICLIALATVVQRSDGPVLLWEGAPAWQGLSITLFWNSATLVFGALLLVATSSWACVDRSPISDEAYAGLLMAEAGALTFFAGDNWASVAAGWLLTDLGLLTVKPGSNTDPQPQWAAFGLSQMGAFTWLVSGIVVSIDAPTLALSESSIGGSAAFLALLAIWIRSGLWPFHSTTPSTPGTLIPRLALPLLLATWLAARVFMILNSPPVQGNWLQALALVGLAASALLALQSPDPERNTAWLTRFAAAPLLYLPFLGASRAAPALAIWLGVGAFWFAVLATVAQALPLDVNKRAVGRAVWVAATLTAAAFLFMPAFLGRTGLYGAALQNGRSMLILVGLATMSLALISLWRIVLYPRVETAARLRGLDYYALVLVALTTLWMVVMPFGLISPFGRGVQDGGAYAYDVLVHPPSLVLTLLVVLMLVLPLLASFLLVLQWRRLSALVVSLGPRLGSLLELGWLGNGLDSVYNVVATTVRQLLGLIEWHPIAWLVFAAIWVALWVLNLPH